jgi:hypothetical protein
MRRSGSVRLLVVVSVVVAALLTPTPDAATMLYTFAFAFGLSGFGYWLGRRSAGGPREG